MGYNTTVFILNDRLDAIERDPERFVRDIVHGLNDGTDRAIGQTTVMESRHADEPRLYLTHQNSIIELSPYSRRTKELDTYGPHSKAVIDRAIESAEYLLAALKTKRKDWA